MNVNLASTTTDAEVVATVDDVAADGTSLELRRSHRQSTPARYQSDLARCQEQHRDPLPGKAAVSVNDTYTDLHNLGAIFGVPQRAAQLIASMQAEIASVHATIAALPSVPVFVYDSGQDAPFTAPGLAIPNDLIAQAGGTNVFADLRQTWTAVSWEQVVARQPACILINDYSTPTWQQKQQFLESFQLTKNLPAVRDKCVQSLTYDQLSPGPRNADAVVALARWLHPEAFGLPGR